jgi:hypothetical protein
MKAVQTFVALLGAVALCMVGCQGHRQAGADKTTVASQPDAKNLPRVIVKSFVGKGITENEASTLGEQFCMQLSKANKADLFCPGDLGQLLKHKELQLSFGECQEEDCLSTIGEKVNADLFVLGTISKVGEVFVVQVNLANGKTGKVQTRVSHQVDSDKVDDLLPAMTVVADKVLAEM